MIESIIYVVLAILGLGFLIFIHELGHLIVGKVISSQHLEQEVSPRPVIERLPEFFKCLGLVFCHCYYLRYRQ